MDKSEITTIIFNKLRQKKFSFAKINEMENPLSKIVTDCLQSDILNISSKKKLTRV